MAFVRIEDRMPDGPKFDGIPSSAGWLHICAMAYAAHKLTDGFIPEGRVYKLTNDPPKVVNAAIDWLTTIRPGCSSPLWHAVKGGWTIHDYDDPEFANPTRATADAFRELGRRGGLASVNVRRQRYGTAQPNSTARTDAEAGASEPLRSDASNPPVAKRSEARPVPYRTSPYISPPNPPPAAGDKATVILHGFLEASNKSSYSAMDAVKAQEYAGDFQRASGEQIADWLREHAEWMASQKKRPYGKLEYYAEYLRQKHDWLSDNGVRMPGAASGRGGELTPISAELRAVDPDDE